MALEDYKDIVAFLANVMAIGQSFAGVFECKTIIKQNSTKNVQVIPFFGGISMCLMFLRYSYILDDFAMLPLCYIGLLLNILYSLCFAYYHDKKADLVKQFSQILLVTFIIVGYTFIEDPKHVEYRYGLITTVIMLLLIASPFLQLGEVLKTKSTESLPFSLILSGTAVSVLFLLYGVITDNGFMQFQNAVASILSVAQLSLFFIFPSKSAVAKKQKKKN